MPSLPSRLCPAYRGNICHQVRLTSYSLVVELIKVMNRLDLIGLDDVKDEARFFCHGALSTFCLSTELRQNSCHTTVLSNMSLTLTFISQAEPPPPPSVWSLSLLSHYNKPVKCTCDGNSSKSCSSRILFTKYTSSKFSGWDCYDLLFGGCCQTYSPQYFSQMKQRNCQSREFAGFAFAGGRYSCITLSTAHTGREKIIQHCTFRLVWIILLPGTRSIGIFLIKSLSQSCPQVNVNA